jgi:hypothetical protein
MELEVWKPVRGFEDYYEVSNFGRVRSLEREVRNTLKSCRVVKGRILSLNYRKGKYVTVGLSKDQVVKTFSVHTLVAEAFIREVPKGMCVNHINADKHDNYVSNLEIVTYSENIKHAHRLGLNYSPCLRGEDSGKSYFKEADVLKIRKMREEGNTFKVIANTFNCSISTISNIVYKKTWNHI